MKPFTWIAGTLFAASVAFAEVQPGDVITRANVAKARELVGPGVAWCVEHGMTMTIVPSKKIEWPRRYRAATEANAGQVRISSDGNVLENYVAGLPFPAIDPNDPEAALKIMWNYQYKPLITDDVLMRDFQVPSGPLTYTAPMVPDREFVVGDMRRRTTTAGCSPIPSPNCPIRTESVTRKS